jgi:hypothetical protein
MYEHELLYNYIRIKFPNMTADQKEQHDYLGYQLKELLMENKLLKKSIGILQYGSIKWNIKLFMCRHF